SMMGTSALRQQTPAPRLAWLFDIDGTLLLTEGASREAFSAAVRDRFGIDTDLRDVPFAGRTELRIFADILRSIDRTVDEWDEAHFWDAVFGHMRAALRPGRGAVLPGVIELLDAIAMRPEWVVGLLTGNMTQMARLKLAHYGLTDRFAFGSFGEEAEDRDALACLAVARVAREHGVPAERCIVVGDTV